MATTSRRQAYHHGDLKRALTSAALSLVAEKGPKGFTLTEAARRAGVSAAAPYRHFADKAALLAAVAEQGFSDLHDALVAASDAGSPRDRVIELGCAYVRWAVAHPDHYRVMFGADIEKADHPSLAVAAERAFGDLLQAISQCSGVDGGAAAGPLWSLVHGVSLLAIGGEFRAVGIKEDPEAMIAQVVSGMIAD